MNSYKKQKPLKFIGCRNDESIIAQMKKLGIWEKMQALSKPGETASMIYDDALFIWHGTLGDSGYTWIKPENPCDLLIFAALVFSKPVQLH